MFKKRTVLDHKLICVLKLCRKPLNILLSYTQVIPLQQLSRQRRYKLFLSFMVLVLLLAKSVNFVDEAGDFSPRVSFNLYINYRKYKKYQGSRQEMFNLSYRKDWVHLLMFYQCIIFQL